MIILLDMDASLSFFFFYICVVFCSLISIDDEVLSWRISKYICFCIFCKIVIETSVINFLSPKKEKFNYSI